jgi:peptide/nickel transport system permease protein
MTRTRSIVALSATLIAGLLLLAAILGFLWTPYDPIAINITQRLKPPSFAHPFGTDEFGRDVLSRILRGAGITTAISAATVAAAMSAGTLIGLLAGYFRGWTDKGVTVVNDALMAFPGILLALGLLVVTGQSNIGMVSALAIAYVPVVVRVVRANVLSLREREYIESSLIIGNSHRRTILAHVLPNCVAPLTVLATAMFGWVILSESALSFLGLGVAPPEPSWGNMLAASRNYAASAAWLGFFPGLFISLALLSTNLLGDAIRDRLDPRMAQVT